MNPCRATVKESGGSFTISQISHKHDPETGTAVACKVVKKIKEIVVTDVFRPASAIVENVLLETLEIDRPCSALPKVNFMARNANRYRQRLRPEEPRDLDLELKEDCLPDGFLRGDVRVKDRRHLIFATKEQLKLLAKTKHWYA